MTTFEIDYDGNIHYEDYQQKTYDTCWKELINDKSNTLNNYCNCLTKKRKRKTFICKCTPEKVEKTNKMKK